MIFFGFILFNDLCIVLLIIIKGELLLFRLVLLWSIKVGVEFGLLLVCCIFNFVIVLESVCVGLVWVFVFKVELLILVMELVILEWSCVFL